MKEKYDIEGMTCSACQAAVEKAVNKIEGVKEVNVNLLNNSMDIEYDDNVLNSKNILKAVSKVGYKAKLKGEKTSEPTISSNSTNVLIRLITSIVFALALVYISMGPMIGIPIPSFLLGIENALVYAFSQFLLTLPVLYLNRQYFISGFEKLFKRHPNMDSLIAIGASAAVLYGIFAIYRIGYGLGIQDLVLVEKYHHDLYFESASVILTLVTLGKFLESKSTDKTKAAIEKMIELAPKRATLLINGEEVEVDVNEVKIGDIVVVKQGGAIPVDGKIIEGQAAIDEANITGESIPVYKEVNDNVVSSTIVNSGYIKFEANKVGENTTIATIIKLVEEASSSKAPISKLADKISGIFVPIVIGLALISGIVFAILGYGFEFSLGIGITVLVISCPCALGLATPVSIMVGTGKGAQLGLLIKDAESLEKAHNIKTVVLDKTGTITEGRPEVVDIINYSNLDLLEIAYALESKSEHPLALSIIDKAKSENKNLLDTTNYKAVGGRGIQGQINNQIFYAGNLNFAKDLGLKDIKLEKEIEQLAKTGKTPLIFMDKNQVIGIIAVKDPIKKSSVKAVKELKNLGINVVMLTGDNEITARAIASETGIEKVISGVLPTEKQAVIKSLQSDKKHAVAMVGDGVNDAIALTSADLGIAIGAGTDIAIESADIILTRNDLNDVKNVILLSKRVMNTIKLNLFWAFFYNVIGIFFASGILYPALGIKLSPMIAALAMSFSSIFVVTNALTINLFKIKKGEEK